MIKNYKINFELCYIELKIQMLVFNFLLCHIKQKIKCLSNKINHEINKKIVYVQNFKE